MSQIIESDRRCVRCHKRMAVDIGQNDNSAGEGWVRMVHFCLSCPYTETDESWKRAPVVEVARSSSGRTAAELLLAQRQGWVVPMVFDTEPFPKSEFDQEEVPSA